jgi:hypothetical protein
MENQPAREFGKRRPVKAPTAAPPVKRSRHVALLLMGTLAVGGSAYALMPGENCELKGAGMAAPSLPQTGAGCAPRGSSSSGGHGGSGGSWSRRAAISSAATPRQTVRHPARLASPGRAKQRAADSVPLRGDSRRIFPAAAEGELAPHAALEDLPFACPASAPMPK